MAKVGAGTLAYTGTIANTYTLQTTVAEGTLLLAKTGVAIAGPLVVGDFAGTDSVIVLSNTESVHEQQGLFVRCQRFVQHESRQHGAEPQRIARDRWHLHATAHRRRQHRDINALFSLSFNASAIQVQSALTTLLAGAPFDLGTNAANDVAVIGSQVGAGNPVIGGLYTVIFQGDLADSNIAPLTITNSSLSPAPVGVTTVYAGTTSVIGTIGTLNARRHGQHGDSRDPAGRRPPSPA